MATKDEALEQPLLITRIACPESNIKLSAQDNLSEAIADIDAEIERCGGAWNNVSEQEPKSWVDENDAWIDSVVDESEDEIFSAGISTPYHGHCIQVHANSEKQALDLIEIIFNSLKRIPNERE
jgi:hypothetical protein